MNRKGFTLVELIATLVVLGIVVGITIVSVNGIFGSAKEKSEEVFVGTIKDALDMYIASADARKLFSDRTVENCSTLKKSHGNVSVKMVEATFEDLLTMSLAPLTQSDLVNPSNEKNCVYDDVKTDFVPQDIKIYIYRDDDYVYYYRVEKNDLKCDLDTSETDKITNLPLVGDDYFSC